MTIERQPDIFVVTVVLTNGLTIDHRYPIGNVRSLQEFERAMVRIIREPIDILMGTVPAKGFILAYPVAAYNTAHVMTLRVRGEGSSQAMQAADHVHEMGFLARDRRA